jgi:hypothetical protein
MSALRSVYDRNYNAYRRLRQRKRPYTIVYDRRKHWPGYSDPWMLDHY